MIEKINELNNVEDKTLIKINGFNNNGFILSKENDFLILEYIEKAKEYKVENSITFSLEDIAILINKTFYSFYKINDYVIFNLANFDKTIDFDDILLVLENKEIQYNYDKNFEEITKEKWYEINNKNYGIKILESLDLKINKNQKNKFIIIKEKVLKNKIKNWYVDVYDYFEKEKILN